MCLEKRVDQRADLRAGVFQNVVPRIGERVHDRLRKPRAPAGQEGGVEHEITLAPADQHRHVPQVVQVVLDPSHQIVATVPRAERDVLDEAQRRDAVGPRVVRGAIGLAHVAWHPP